MWLAFLLEGGAAFFEILTLHQMSAQTGAEFTCILRRLAP
jgi:hypothetical protein